MFSDHQLAGLERRFEAQRYLSTPERVELATALNLSETQVVYFQLYSRPKRYIIFLAICEHIVVGSWYTRRGRGSSVGKPSSIMVPQRGATELI